MTTKRYLYAALLWSVFILAIVGVPGEQIPKVSHFIDLLQPDKLVHIGMFAPFSFLWIRYFYKKLNSRKKAIVLAMLFGMLYAVATELLQIYVFIGRSGNFPDAIADFFGALVGIFYFISKINK